jgi:hypothetical protein
MTQLTLFEAPEVEMLTWYHAKHRNGMFRITTSHKQDLERHAKNPDWQITVETFPRPSWYKLR